MLPIGNKDSEVDEQDHMAETPTTKELARLFG